MSSLGSNGSSQTIPPVVVSPDELPLLEESLPVLVPVLVSPEVVDVSIPTVVPELSRVVGGRVVAGGPDVVSPLELPSVSTAGAGSGQPESNDARRPRAMGAGSFDMISPS
jgi:hypothetical protein